jgi:hypothetical protein
MIIRTWFRARAPDFGCNLGDGIGNVRQMQAVFGEKLER